MDDDTFLSRYKEFVTMLITLDKYQNLTKLLNYHSSLMATQEEHTKRIIELKKAVTRFVANNIASFDSINKSISFRGSIDLHVGNACIDLEHIWSLATDDEKSDILQYLFGIIEKIHSNRFDIHKKIHEIYDTFGKGTPEDEIDDASLHETTNAETGAGEANASSSALDIDKIFGGDSKEDKFVRDLKNTIMKKTKGKTSMSAMTQLMNPNMLKNLIGGKKKGIKLKSIMKKIADTIPDDAEI